MDISRPAAVEGTQEGSQQVNLEILARFGHLNPRKLSALDRLRNLQATTPGMDPLGLPMVRADGQDAGTDGNAKKRVGKRPLDAIIDELVPEVVEETAPAPPPTDMRPWHLQDLVLGHRGHVTSLCVDPMDKFYASGSADSTIKFWDLATNALQLTLTGHIMAIRGMCVSRTMPYLFSCSEDKTVKCWDLEKNKVVRDYHGHLSSVYCIDLDDNKSQIITGSRDSSVRVWDVRTRNETMLLSGHKGSVMKVQSMGDELISSSLDTTVKRWDLRTGRCMNTLTYHTKGVRAFAANDSVLVSGSTNGFKRFTLPSMAYVDDLQYFSGHDPLAGNIIVNTMAINDDMLFAGCDDGKLGFWHIPTGQLVQETTQTPVPGSLQGENGILCSMVHGTRLFTGSTDKSIRIYTR